MFRQRGNSVDFWDKFWKERLKAESLEEYYQNYRHIPILEKVAISHLPKDGNILDAGCGSGVWTYWLKQRGYDVEGIDISKNVIDSIKTALPELSVRVGDVFDLDYADSSFAGYFSMGVMGYFEDGPEKILKEAARVLKKDGVVITRIPYFNLVRGLKNLLGFYKSKESDNYQFAFTVKEIRKQMDNIGLKIIKTNKYDSMRGFQDEISGIKKLRNLVSREKNDTIKKSNNGSRLIRRILLEKIFNMPPMRNLFSDSIVIVAKKV